MPEPKPSELKYYERPDGKKPFGEWYSALISKDATTAAKVGKYLSRLEQGNWSNAKILSGGQGVWEMVIDAGPGYRVYFAQAGNTIVLLLLGGSKKEQQKDIQRAIELWDEFKERNKEKKK